MLLPRPQRNRLGPVGVLVVQLELAAVVAADHHHQQQPDQLVAPAGVVQAPLGRQLPGALDVAGLDRHARSVGVVAVLRLGRGRLRVRLRPPALFLALGYK